MVEKLSLKGLDPAQTVQKIKTFLSKNYQYSLSLRGKEDAATPLQNFLHHTRRGHCELFASATVLMLRQAGIPARYVTGFLAHEYSTLEKRVLVRERDAHAWTRFFINGQWMDVDTTPMGFWEADLEASGVHPFSDFFSWLWFSMIRWRHETAKDLLEQLSLYMIIPLVILLVIRLKKSSRIQRKQPEQKDIKLIDTESESPFYDVEKHFSEKGLPRYPHETGMAWTSRIEKALSDKKAAQDLVLLITLHNRLRFSPSGLTSTQMKQLRQAGAYLMKIDQINDITSTVDIQSSNRENR